MSEEVDTLMVARERSRHWLAALVLGAGMLTGGITLVHAAPAKPPVISRVAQQATPAASPSPATTAQPCKDQPDEPADHEEQQGQQEDRDTGAQVDQQESDHEDAGNAGDDAQAVNGTEQAEDESTAQPGTLTKGQDLLPQAKITVDQAIAAAQAQATGDLGTVELEHRDGTLAFEVTIGNQEVFVDATTGTILAVQPVTPDTSTVGNCEQDDENAAPGTLDDGKELLSQAKITVDQAIAAAQAAAQGPLGTVDLEQENGVLVYHVHIGDQEVTVDAATGAVLGIASDESD